MTIRSLLFLAITKQRRLPLKALQPICLEEASQKRVASVKVNLLFFQERHLMKHRINLQVHSRTQLLKHWEIQTLSFRKQMTTATSMLFSKKKGIIYSLVKITCMLKMEAAILLQICLARVVNLSTMTVDLLKSDLKSTLAFKRKSSLFSMSKRSKSPCRLQSSSNLQLHSFSEAIIRNLFKWTKMKKVAMLWTIISASQ